MKLVVIGTAAGLFSGLLGVGGGTIVVPLLMLWMGFDERKATGTSLAAVACIAAVGASFQALYGNVDFTAGLLIGIPAIAGVLLGTYVQQRLPLRTISLIFVVVLVVSAFGVIESAFDY